MKKILIMCLILAPSMMTFAKETSRKTANADNIATAQFIDSRRNAFIDSLEDMTDVMQEKLAKSLKLSTKGTNAYQAVLMYVQPEGERSNYLNLLKAELVLAQYK